MATRKTHRISIRTDGLTDHQAALLYWAVSTAAESLTEAVGATTDSACDVDIAVLKRLYPGYAWAWCTDAERIALVT